MNGTSGEGVSSGCQAAISERTFLPLENKWDPGSIGNFISVHLVET